MTDQHSYGITVTWTGNRGAGTASYTSYGRDHEIRACGVPTISGSADPAFRGDPGSWNPEQLLVASLSQCHMLWYLHLASAAGITVTAYEDQAKGTLGVAADGAGQFTRVTLRPRVVLSPDSDLARALSLHGEVSKYCFIARSVNFPVDHDPEILVEA